jgi:hypothetical protein
MIIPKKREISGIEASFLPYNFITSPLSQSSKKKDSIRSKSEPQHPCENMLWKYIYLTIRNGYYLRLMMSSPQSLRKWCQGAAAGVLSLYVMPFQAIERRSSFHF